MRSSFGPSDFCHALRRLALETGAAEPVVNPSPPSPGEAAVGRVYSGQGRGKGGDRRVWNRGRDRKVEKVAQQLTPAEVELAVAMVQVNAHVLCGRYLLKISCCCEETHALYASYLFLYTLRDLLRKLELYANQVCGV